MDQENNLRPCPFCGDSNLNVFQLSGDVWRVMHTLANRTRCNVGITEVSFDEALAAWNNRTSDPMEVLVETTELGRSSGTVMRYDGLLGDVVRRIHEERERQVKELNTTGRDLKDWVVDLMRILGRVSTSAYNLTGIKGAMRMNPGNFVEVHKTRSKLCADDIVELGAAVMRMAEHVVEKSDIKF